MAETVSNTIGNFPLTSNIFVGLEVSGNLSSYNWSMIILERLRPIHYSIVGGDELGTRPILRHKVGPL